MAQKVTVVLEDDLDGGQADETVRVGFGGTEYELNLSAKNAAARAVRRACPQGWPRSGPPGSADCGCPAGQRRGPGMGERPRRRGQRARQDPGQRHRAVPGRQRTLNQTEPRANACAKY